MAANIKGNNRRYKLRHLSVNGPLPEDIHMYMYVYFWKAELKAVSPSEDFTCSLGVDPGLRVVYKPVYKYREQSGLLTKSVITTYKQVMRYHRIVTQSCVCCTSSCFILIYLGTVKPVIYSP